MRQQIRRVVILSAASLLGSLLLPASAVYASQTTTALSGACGGAAAQSSYCQTVNTGGGGDPIAGSNGVLGHAVNIIAIIAGIAAVIIIIIAGIKYITSQGDPAAVSNAKQTIIYAAIGLVVVALARQIISYVINKL